MPNRFVQAISRSISEADSYFSADRLEIIFLLSLNFTFLFELLYLIVC